MSMSTLGFLLPQHNLFQMKPREDTKQSSKKSLWLPHDSVPQSSANPRWSSGKTKKNLASRVCNQWRFHSTQLHRSQMQPRGNTKRFSKHCLRPTYDSFRHRSRCKSAKWALSASCLEKWLSSGCWKSGVNSKAKKQNKGIKCTTTWMRHHHSAAVGRR